MRKDGERVVDKALQNVLICHSNMYAYDSVVMT